jgi:hypothetical protein
VEYRVVVEPLAGKENEIIDGARCFIDEELQSNITLIGVQVRSISLFSIYLHLGWFRPTFLL